MDIYNALKPVLLGLVVIIAGGRAIQHYGKNENKDMWVTILIGGLIYFFVNGPANTLNAFSGLMNSVLTFIQGLGG
ncbi:TcpD family membrane protein [Leuconostoc suionicum]|uniref:TcpD family membrane protein n=1 Tax=Leuconostoc TaxID=1243 RepID=UPI0001DB5848|nr:MULTISPECIES: TcpD family membrane protein [Leuconostoc]MDN6081824.1 hypothetical protein [Leuconostoc sp.]MBZ5957737.1 hypothetical protein [Leuconostoc gasicomitatum]MBZ5969756.1 hypothetical protein [Leuconostoc gasicomitatum]MCT3039257.1 hypothetical protein [Leuconostoc mesenteroides]MDI6498751.1 TcpD family membrane protein [Leuconostoc suionicum]